MKIETANKTIDGINNSHKKVGERIHELEDRIEVIYYYKEYNKMEKIKVTLKDKEHKLNEQQQHTPGGSG